MRTSGIFLPSLFDNVLMTLVLVVFDKLSTGQPDFLREISPGLLFLLPAIPKPAQPKQSQKHVIHMFTPGSNSWVLNKRPTVF